MFSISLLNYSFCSCISLKSLIVHLMFSCSSVSIYRIISILNSLPCISWGSVTRGLLYSFGVHIFWFFVNHVTLHRHPHIWKSSNVFLTLCSDFNKGNLSPEDGGTSHCDVTQGVVQGRHLFQGESDFSLIQATGVPSINCVVLSTAEGQEWLLGS